MNSKSVSSARFRFANTFSVALLFAFTVAQSLGADDELDVALPSDVGLDASKLNEITARIRSNPNINIHSVLVVKDNKLVFEEYFSGKDQSWGEDLGVVNFDSDSLHDLRSVTKSITSALVGIAIAEFRSFHGLPPSSILPRFSTYDWSTFWGSLRNDPSYFTELCGRQAHIGFVDNFHTDKGNVV